MNKRELIKLSAEGFVDDIYDQMRKEDYSEDYQIEVISEIQKILINELKIENIFDYKDFSTQEEAQEYEQKLKTK